MHLFLTDPTFTVHGQPYPGIPFLIDDQMALVTAPNEYLFHVAVVRGRTSSPKTWQTYGNHLYEFFSFLETIEISWDRIRSTHLAAWRDSMLSRGCRRSTVNHRVGAVPRREGYSAGEQERIIAACAEDLALFNANPEALSSHQVLAVHAVITVLTCGVNMTPLLEMRRDSLRSFLPDRDLLVLEKRRGYTTRTISLPKNTPEETATPITKMVGDYLRQLQQYTERFVSDADEADRPFVFLCRLADVTYSRRRGNVVRFDEVQVRNALKSFVNRHELFDDRGAPLNLSIARLRPTFALNYYLRHRDLRKLQQALGHSSILLTIQRYIPPVTPEAVRNHAFIGQAMVGWATSRDETLAIRLAADGEIPLRNATELLTGGYNTSIARCQNPFREADQVCGKFLACFRCPSMVVFEDDLYRLYSFYFRLLAERPKIPPHQWMKTFGPVIRTIDEQIAVQFDSAVVAEARQRAQSTPHPAWRNDAPLI